MKYLPYLIVFFLTFSCSKEEETDPGPTAEETLDAQFRAANRLAAAGIQLKVGPPFEMIEKVAFDFAYALEDCKRLGLTMSQAGFAWKAFRREVGKPFITPTDLALRQMDERFEGTIDDFNKQVEN